jgi:tellurite resistance protein TerA
LATNTLQPGGNLTLGAFTGAVTVSHDAADDLDINLTAFILDEHGKAQGDAAVVYYNQPADPGGAATFTEPVSSGGLKVHRIDFDIRRTPSPGGRIAVTLTEDRGMGFAAARNLRAEVRVGDQVIEMVPHAFAAEKGLIVLELYLRNEQPKVRAVWQGFASGLAGLCRHYGVEVEEPAVPAPAVAAPAAPSLVTLSKPGQTHKVSLRKDAAAPRIVVRALWYDNGDGSDDNDDLDLRVGILLPDGRMQMIQAPNDVGAFDKPPCVRHQGDVTVASDAAPGVESVEVNPDIFRHLGGRVALVFSVYSAVSNGAVSVASLRPRMRMEYGDQVVECVVEHDQDKMESAVYTHVIGLIEIDQDAIVLSPSKETSAPRSEATPWLAWGPKGVQLTMDGPPVFKDFSWDDGEDWGEGVKRYSK